MNLMKPEEETKGSIILGLSLDLSSILGAAAIGDSTGIAAAVIRRIAGEVVNQVILPLTSRSESKRLYQWAKQAAEGIAQRSKNREEFRKDGFFEETPTNRSNFEEVVESTLKKVMDTTEEPKVKFMANLTENIHFDQDLDIDTYRQILKDLDELSYRQLCMIRLTILYEKQEVNLDPILYDEQVEKMSQNEQTRFYSIGRDFEKLVDNRCVIPEYIPRDEENNEPFLYSPKAVMLPDYTRQLYLSTNLDEISIEDICEIFLPWNVRQIKPEK